MLDSDLLVAEAYDDGIVTEVIRPAAVVPEGAARVIIVEMALQDLRRGGAWLSEPASWRRYDISTDPATAVTRLIGTIEIAFGVPTRYEITIFRVTLTSIGTGLGWTITSLCDEALGLGGLTLASCPRADLTPPPRPFRY
jgi:hypothetical protein